MNFAKKILGTFIGLSVFLGLFSAEGIPPRPDPPRLVNDFSGLLSSQETQALESKLVAFDDSTSTQIAVVIVNDLKGYDVSQFAYEVLHTWQVGQKGKNNGIVILLKPKTLESKGETFICTGYGMEHLVTDALTRRIVEIEMIPQFRQNNYYGGIDAAINAVMLASKGQYKGVPKTRHNGGGGTIIFLIIFIIIILAIISSRKQKYDSEHHSSGGSSLPWWLLMGAILGSSNDRSSGSWGSFSSGSDSFGGFGGGDSGGGGAGGSW